MLRKLMRYDFRAVRGMWLIMALTLPVMSLLTGGAFSLKSALSYGDTGYILVTVISGLLMFLFFMTFIAAIVLTLLFCHRRFYTNFFTDEGYLTFTLPVKRRDLVLSKTVCTFVMTLGMVAVCVVSLLLLALTAGEWNDMVVGWAGGLFKRLFAQFGGITTLYIIEAFFLLLLLLCFYQFIIQFSITVGSIVAKKHKILAAIGIYYVASNVLELLIGLGASFIGTTVGFSAFRFAEQAATGRTNAVLGLLLLLAILFAATLDLLLYLVTLSLVERRLNLA